MIININFISSGFLSIYVFLLSFSICLAIPFLKGKIFNFLPIFFVIFSFYIFCAVGFSVDRLSWGNRPWFNFCFFVFFGLYLIKLLSINPIKVGLRLPKLAEVWKPCLIAFSFSIIFCSILLLLHGPNPVPDMANLLFEATMPGLEEEFCFRGLIPYFFISALSKNYKNKSIQLLAIIFTSSIFALVHVVYLQNNHIQFTPGKILYSFPFGLILGWLRLKTFSIYPGIIIHNFINVIFSCSYYFF